MAGNSIQVTTCSGTSSDAAAVTSSFAFISTGVDSSTNKSSESTVATITELVVRDIYILLGSIGMIGNLFVVFIIMRYSDMNHKVRSDERREKI